MSTFAVRRAERRYRYLGSASKVPSTPGMSITVSSSRGTFQSRRVYADFVIDGFSLSEQAQQRGDLISCLGWGTRKFQDEHVARLLLQTAPELSGNRVALYVCPECGDVACGAVTVAIEKDRNVIVWRDFGYETGMDNDPPELDTRDLEDLGPFRFEWSQYRAAILSGYGMGGFDAQKRLR